MGRTVSEPGIRERLSGRWALSWQAYAITVPLAIASLVVWSRTPVEVLGWIGIGVTAMGAVGGWTYLMHRTAFRDRATKGVPLSWVVGSSVIAATLFVSVSLGLSLVTGLSDTTRLVPDPIPTLIFATGWGLAIVLILESRWRFRVQRQELIDQAVQHQLAVLQEREVLDQIRQSIRAEVGAELAPAREGLGARIDELVEDGTGEVEDLAAQLRQTADATVRPLSHRLEQQARRRHRSPDPFSVLRTIARYQPFRPVAVSAVYLFTVTPTEISRNGLARGAIILGITVALILLMMSIVNGAMRRWPEHHTAIFLGGIAFVQIPAVVLAPMESAITGVPVSGVEIAASILLGTIIILATSAFGAWNRARQEMIRDFTTEVAEEQILTLARSAAIAEAAREAAVILHGGVQSQLRACATALDSAAATEDVVAVNRALVQARAILERPLPDLQPRMSPSLGALVEQRAAEWEGLTAISLSIDPAIRSVDGPIARNAAEIVEEGIANAIHHGQASRVRVRITGAPDGVRLAIFDDGLGPRAGSAGFGSRRLDALGAMWTLSATDEGSVLQVLLPRTVSVG